MNDIQREQPAQQVYQIIIIDSAEAESLCPVYSKRKRTRSYFETDNARSVELFYG